MIRAVPGIRPQRAGAGAAYGVPGRFRGGARLGQGIAAGSYYWVLYGIGAVIGPLLSGHLADRAGFAAALRAAFLIEAVAVALPP